MVRSLMLALLAVQGVAPFAAAEGRGHWQPPPPCQEYARLRDDAARWAARAVEIFGPWGDHKAQCAATNRAVEAAAAIVIFLRDTRTLCSVPSDMIEKAAQQYDKIENWRDQICPKRLRISTEGPP
jgi:hypothetical protein